MDIARAVFREEQSTRASSEGRGAGGRRRRAGGCRREKDVRTARRKTERAWKVRTGSASETAICATTERESRTRQREEGEAEKEEEAEEAEGERAREGAKQAGRDRERCTQREGASCARLRHVLNELGQ